VSLFQSLQRELQGHRSRIDDVLERAGIIGSIRSPEANCVRAGYDQLAQLWALLWAETERRQLILDAMYQAQQYYFDTAEVEAWLSEQELHMMNEEKGKVPVHRMSVITTTLSDTEIISITLIIMEFCWTRTRA